MKHGAHSERELLSPGMRVLIRGQEWLVDRVELNSLGNHAVFMHWYLRSGAGCDGHVP